MNRLPTENPARRLTKKLGPATESPDVWIIPFTTAGRGCCSDYARERKARETIFALGFISIRHCATLIFIRHEFAGSSGISKQRAKLAGHRSAELRRYTDQPKVGEIPEENQRQVVKHISRISYIDAQIGRVLDELTVQGSARTPSLSFGAITVITLASRVYGARRQTSN